MPKKDKVVDTEDDARYMTIYQPFPFGGNWELESDYIQLLYWLACCTGKDALFAVLHRPKSASMVIIEVDKDFPDFNVLLGEHRWNQFLRNPTEDEAGRTSKIYYSTYSTSMEAKKDGWKRIHVESCFFDKWAPVNSKVAHPYPKSGYCDVPPENVTTKRLCRPLPMTFQPRPGLQHTKAPANQKPVRQVPGASWADETEAQLFTGDSPNPTLAGASSKGKKKKGKKKGNDTAVVSSPTSPTSGIAWDTPIYTPNTKGNISSPTNDFNTNAKAIVPPGLTHPSFSASANQTGNSGDGWGIPDDSPLQSPSNLYNADFPAPPGLVRGITNSSIATTSTTSSTQSGFQTPNVQVVHPPNPVGLSGYESLVNKMDNVSLGGAMNGEKPGGGVIVMSQYEEDEDEDGPGRYLAPYERVPVSQNDDEWSVVGTNGKKGAKDGTKVEDPPNYWNNLPVKKPTDPDEIVCTTHGKICSRGICTTYAKLKREKKFAEERKKKEEERKLRLKEKKRKEKEKKKEEGSNRGGDGSESEDDDDDDSGSQGRKRYNNNNNNGDRRGFGDRKPRYIEPPIRDPKLSTAWATPPPPVANKPDAWSSRAAPSTAARGPQPGDTPTHTYTMPNVPPTKSTSTEPPIRNPKLSTAWATAPPLANKSKEFPPVGSSSTAASRTAPSTAWGPKSGDTPTYTYTMPSVPTKPIPQAHVEPSKPVNTSKAAVKKEEEEEEPKAAIPTLAQYMGDDSDEDDYF